MEGEKRNRRQQYSYPGDSTQQKEPDNINTVIPVATLNCQVEVVEVKSKDDITSHAQKAWLMELENARVPAMVTRVLAEKEAS